MDSIQYLFTILALKYSSYCSQRERILKCFEIKRWTKYLVKNIYAYQTKKLVAL